MDAHHDTRIDVRFTRMVVISFLRTRMAMPAESGHVDRGKVRCRAADSARRIRDA
jgi:hypothetical protein